MAEARSQTSRRWLWAGAVVVLLAVFFTARYFLRERLPVRVAAVEHAMLINTVSTDGRVEPAVNYQFYSPIATTVKAVYAQEGDTVPAGKLLVTLDDEAARAQVAAAESAVSRPRQIWTRSLTMELRRSVRLPLQKSSRIASPAIKTSMIWMRSPNWLLRGLPRLAK